MTGSSDPFRAVTDWDEETARAWADALDLRAAGADQARVRQRLRERAGLRAGDTAVEFGCGTGHLLLELAGDVGPSGRVLGVEPQPFLAERARRRAAGTAAVSVHTGPAQEVPVNGSVTACLAQTVLIHLPPADLAEVLAGARRMLRPGGRMLSADQDGDTWVIDHPDRATTREIVTFNTDQRYADGWTGRRLARLLGEAGFTDITTEVIVHVDTEPGSYLLGMAQRLATAAAEAGAIEAVAARAWMEELRDIAVRGAFFSSINYYVSSGTQPA
ncbi:MAG TPA: methyltransferase domain-containing protein [Streptosporangiaceae bacterium]|nr:methyltransferase domain-containing protein [Streptosporangiaceae bacterium]